jgi:hypothetical protein
MSGNQRKDLYGDAQSRHNNCGGVTTIPKANTSAKSGTPAGTEAGTDKTARQDVVDLEKKKLELEIECATLQSAINKQHAEAERDLIKATLERERMQTASTLEQAKQHGELYEKLLHQPAVKRHEGKTTSDANSGYVAELVSYHAIKRVSAEIIRGISAVVGLGNDVRILIVDRQDYATGDIPFIEITSQLSVLEVRCRKQIATNKELTHLALQKEDYDDDGKTPAGKPGATRLAPLASSPVILPATASGVTTLPSIAGAAGAAPDISGYFRSDNSFREQDFSVKTEGLIAAVAGSLKSEKRYVYVYNLYSMDTTGPQSKLMNMYAGVLDCSSRLAQSRNRLLYFIGKKTEMLAEQKISLKNLRGGKTAAESEQEITTLKEEIKRETSWLDQANMEVLASDAIHRELGMFVKNVTTADTVQPASKLAQAVFREKVHELGITHLLYLGVLSSGGESVTRKWLLGTGTTSYLGGAVASYVLSRVGGEVLASEILPAMYSFGFDPAGQRNSPLKQIRFEKQEPKK